MLLTTPLLTVVDDGSCCEVTTRDTRGSRSLPPRRALQDVCVGDFVVPVFLSPLALPSTLAFRLPCLLTPRSRLWMMMTPPATSTLLPQRPSWTLTKTTWMTLVATPQARKSSWSLRSKVLHLALLTLRLSRSRAVMAKSSRTFPCLLLRISSARRSNQLLMRPAPCRRRRLLRRPHGLLQNRLSRISV